MRKKFLSALLSLCMVLTLLPCEAFAAGTDTHTHQYTVLVSVLQKGNCATGEKGIAKYKCSVEGCTKTTYKTVDAGHTEPASGVTTVPATCGKDGSKSYTCTVCSQAVTEVLPATGQHEEVEGVIDATCTENSKVGTKCKICGIQLGEAEEVPGTALGHNFKMTVIKAATCTEDGSRQMKCTRCDATQGEVQTIKALGHNWVDDGAFQSATCEHPGQQPQKCSRCQETQIEVPTNEDGSPMAPQLEHDYGAETKTPATCTDPAYITRTCQRQGCGHVDNQVDTTVNNGQSLGHDWKTIETVKANCQEGGYTGQICQRQGCGGDDGPASRQIDETPADPNAHVISTDADSKSTVLSEADCSKKQNAVVKAVCEVCGKSLGYKSVPYEHTYNEGNVTTVTPATCTEAGSGTVACTVCTTTKTVEIPAAGHTWAQIGATNPDADGWVVTKAPTCGETGLKSRNCSVCDVDDAADVEVPATGEHEFIDKVVEATCQHGRSAGSFCKVCDAQNPDEEPVSFGDPVDHSYTVEVTDKCEEATCTTDGKTVMKCQWCDAEKETVIPATGHTEPTEQDEITVIPADCESPMKVSFTCSVCNEVVEVSVDDGDFVPGQHSWGAWETNQEATCTQAGSKTRTCEKCGKEETEEIPITAHTTTDVVVEATCAAGGYTVKHCSVCDQDIGDHFNETQPNPNKHVYGDSENHTYLQEPTCTTSGVELKICDNCGKRSYVSVPAEHKYNEGQVTTQATCAAPGEKTFTCSVCNATKTEEIPQLTTHTWANSIGGVSGSPDTDGWIVTEEATCGTPGSKSRQCTVEGCTLHTVETAEIPTTGEHTWVETTTSESMGDDFNACIHDNVAGFICSVCGATDETRPSEVVQPATGHDWEWTEVASSTCETPGSEKLVCKNCQQDAVANEEGAPAEVTRDLELAEHTIPNKEDGSGPDITYVAGDCETPSGFSYTCSVCNKEQVEYIDDGGTTGKHTWTVSDETDADGWKVTQEATCTAKGAKTRTCSVCGKTETADIQMVAHTLEVKTVPATCKHEGYTINCCSVCKQEQGEKLSTIPVDPNGHVFDGNNDTILQAPSCTTPGVAKKSCTLCGKSTYTAAPAQHTYNEGVQTKAPTCTEPGETTFTCSKCDADTTGHTKTEPIAALGHNYSDTPDATKSVAATCGKDGKSVYVCQNGCGVDKEEVVPATNEHNYVVTTTPATCTEPAMAGEACSVCGAANPDEPMNPVDGSTALGHSWSEWTESKAATCTEDGEEERHCTRGTCDASETRVVKAGHTPGDPEFTAATCTDPAHVVTKCSVCGETLEDEDLTEIAPALGHDPKEIRQEPTCTEDGSTKTICSRCGEVLVEETVLPANGEHEYEMKVIQESTCSAKGIGRPTCKNCGATKSFVALPLADHTWGEEEVRTVDGKQEIWHTCGVCGAEEKVGDVDDPTPSCDHTWEIDPDDSTKHKCSKCSATEAHDYGSGETCTKCGAAKPADPVCQHTNTEVVDAKAATCTEDGSTGKTVCTDCGATVTEAQTIPAKGHTWGMIEDEDGNEVPGGPCTVCGAAYPTAASANESVPAAEPAPIEESAPVEEPAPAMEPVPAESEPIEPAVE